MKVGILTFHSQLNYGGVLQCWALRHVLQSMGHEVVVLDKWLDATNESLLGGLARSPLGRFKWLCQMALGWLGFGHLVRIRRTIRFVRDLGLTPYSFVDWHEVPQDLGVDLIVVGSDQVWNPTLDCTRPYLMEKAPSVRRIAYAASFGVAELSAAQAACYAPALTAFSAVSCREREGVEICRRLGVHADHVVDPTQLVDATVWRQMSGPPVRRKGCRCLTVVYLMAESMPEVLAELSRHVRETGEDLVVLVNNADFWSKTKSLRDVVRRHRGNRLVRFSCGPQEFVAYLSQADRIVTDSFHALMFASVFGTDVRFVRPKNGGWRSPMFARIGEFAENYVRGPLFVSDVGQAFASFEKGERVGFDSDRLQKVRMASWTWLKDRLR